MLRYSSTLPVNASIPDEEPETQMELDWADEKGGTPVEMIDVRDGGYVRANPY